MSAGHLNTLLFFLSSVMRTSPLTLSWFLLGLHSIVSLKVHLLSSLMPILDKPFVLAHVHKSATREQLVRDHDCWLALPPSFEDSKDEYPGCIVKVHHVRQPAPPERSLQCPTLIVESR
jgi:hypothetical protein